MDEVEVQNNYVSVGNDVNFDDLNAQYESQIFQSSSSQFYEQINKNPLNLETIYHNHLQNCLEVELNQDQNTDFQTISSKFNNLSKSLQTFQKKLEFIIKKTQDIEEEKSAGQLLQTIKQLQTSLISFNNYEYFLPLLQNPEKIYEFNSDQLMLMQKPIQDQILNKIQGITQEQINTEGEGNSSIKYQLFLNNEIENEKLQSLFNNIEKEIQEITQKIGINSQYKIQGGLIQKIDYLQKIVNCLQPKGLIELEEKYKQVDYLLEKAFSVAKEESNQLSEIQLTEIANLNKQIQEVETIFNELPQIINKLECQQMLHENQTKTVLQIENILNLQNEMIKETAQDESLIKETESKLQENKEIIIKNLTYLEEKIQTKKN